MKRQLLACLTGCLLGVSLCAAQEPGGRSALAEQARREFRERKFDAAERDFRELTKSDASDLYAQTYLGHSLFRQEKFAEAIAPYEKAHELERSGKKLSVEEHRVLVDQLVMSYGMGGQIKKAHELLDSAIRQDPDYPLNYYNLACAFAEDGDKSKVLANLDLAFRWKANVLKGEQMPDPRSDSSFQKYVRDPDFVSLMKKLGYQ
jgi:predicted Zn-dependent protease